MNVVLSVLKSVGGKILVALFSDVVALKLAVICLNKAIKSDKTGPDLDAALEVVKKQIENIK
jgi:hypothetical protein